MKSKTTYLILVIIIPSLFFSQNDAKIELNKGIEAYEKGEYKKAQDFFETAYALDPDYDKAIYNAGNAAYLNGKFEEAKKYYDSYIHTIDESKDKAEAYHNIGNSLLKNYINNKDANSLEQCIHYYKEALRNNPADNETRYNLSYALKQLQQNKDQQNKDQQNKDQQNKDQQNKDQQNKDQQNKDQQNKDQKPSEEEQIKAEMSKKQALKNLDAINSEEEKVLLKVNRQKGDKKKKKDNVKDW